MNVWCARHPGECYLRISSYDSIPVLVVISSGGGWGGQSGDACHGFQDDKCPMAVLPSYTGTLHLPNLHNQHIA